MNDIELNLAIDRTLLIQNECIMNSDFLRHKARRTRAEPFLSLARTGYFMQGCDSWDADIMSTMSKISAHAFWESGIRYVYMYQWGRDCDQCESNSVSKVRADLETLQAFEEAVYDNAEGPVRCYPISREDAQDFSPSFRDRRAEQYNY